MLRLTKQKGSPHWYIRGTVAGVHIYRSTKTTDRRDADEIRRKVEKETFDAAALGKHPPCTFAQAVKVYDAKGGKSGERRHLVRLLDHFQDTPLAQIGQTEIDAAAAVLFPNAKASTINRQLISPFIAVARAAVKAELPGAVQRPIERRKVQKPVVTPATDEHIEKLLPHCSEGLQALIILMTYTGLRTGEALRLTEGDVKNGYVQIGKTKNGEPRMAPVPDGWKWPTGGFGFQTTQGVGKALRRASAAAGIAYRRGHALGRHSFSARWLRNGGSIKGLKEAGGWKKLAVVDEIYGHLEQTEIHERMRELSRRKK